LLIDFPADRYYHFLQNGIIGDKIKYLFITHAHSDHFYPKDLFIRCGAYAHDMNVPVLQMFCSAKTHEILGDLPENVEVNIIEAYQTVDLGDYRVTALPARHMPGGQPLFYVIQGDKTLLYAHDTGYFYEEVFEFFEKNNIKFDMVSMDCTNVDIPITDQESHMGVPNIERVLKRLEDMGAVNASTIKYINHFSHNGNPLHHILTERVKNLGYNVSYDGCEVEF